MEERVAERIGYIAGRWPLEPGRSTIVFIHGSGGSCLFWKAQVEGLDARVNTLAIDLPGHGRSETKGKEKVEDYTKAVANFIMDINVPNPIPCGLSLGGAIALQLLLDYQKQFKAGMLISTGSRLKVAPVIFDAIANDYNDFVEMLCKFSCSKKTDHKLVHPFREDLVKCKPEVSNGDFVACNSFDISEQLTTIKVPVLVVTAEDDKLTPPKYGEFLSMTIKNAHREHIMDAGHIVPMEKPEEVNRAIADFLDKNGF